MNSPTSRTVKAVTLLESHLRFSVFFGLGGALMTGGLFLLYVLIGTVAQVLGLFHPPYPFLSLEADPIFNIGGAVTGLFIVQGAGSMLLYHFLVGFEDEKSQFAVLMSFISLGFGAALLRITLLRAIRFLQYIALELLT
jgi:hypothetical protein